MRLNDQIRISPVRVIDQHQTQLGVIPVEQALGLSRDAGLDLVEVSPMERPPVCRIMDYGKFKYVRKKRQKNAAGGHVVTLKEIRLRPKTGAHDREIKMNRAKSFLGEGHKVQFTMLFRGRERAHRDIATAIFKAIIDELGESIKVERFPSMEGRRMTMVVAPAKQVKAVAGGAPKPKKPVEPQTGGDGPDTPSPPPMPSDVTTSPDQAQT